MNNINYHNILNLFKNFTALSLNNANNAIVFLKKNQKFKLELKINEYRLKKSMIFLRWKNNAKQSIWKKCVEFVVETTQRKKSNMPVLNLNILVFWASDNPQVTLRSILSNSKCIWLISSYYLLTFIVQYVWKCVTHNWELLIINSNL